MALSIQERVYQKIKQLSDKQLQEVLLFIEFLSLREDKEFKEKLKGTEIAQSKDAKKSFSLEFTELSDKELEKKLKAFEKKYQIDSETLYQRQYNNARRVDVSVLDLFDYEMVF